MKRALAAILALSLTGAAFGRGHGAVGGREPATRRTAAASPGYAHYRVPLDLLRRPIPLDNVRFIGGEQGDRVRLGPVFVGEDEQLYCIVLTKEVQDGGWAWVARFERVEEVAR